MNGQKHIIKREILELTVHEREIALPIQNEASSFVRYRLNPELDKLFSKLSRSDEVVQIDRLVLDLGTISPKNLDEDFLQLALKNAEDQLTKLIYRTKTESVNGKSFKDSEKAEKVKVKSLKANYLDQFIHFLQTGNLSWWKSDETKNPLNSVFEQVLLIDKSSLQKQLLPLVKQDNVKKRLIYQFRDDQIEILLKKLNPQNSESKTVFLQKVQAFFTKTKKEFSLSREAYWNSVFETISEGVSLSSDDQKVLFLKRLIAEGSKSGAIASREKLLSGLLQKIGLELQKAPDKDLQLVVIAILEFSLETGVHTEKLLSIIQQSSTKKNREFKMIHESFMKKMNTSDTIQKDIILAQKAKNDDLEKMELATKIAMEKEGVSLQRQTKILETDEIYISNAGLVILHPYLKYFFDGLGLLSKDLQFKSFDHAVKAIHLLQFIVTKTETNPENELSLNKILCGINISEPIPIAIELTKAEKDECENLLSVVLERWEVLKTKKTEALRENFLKRDGILTTENQGWNLKIERTSLDILLDKLPWGISIIKLPWTEQIIHVEW